MDNQIAGPSVEYNQKCSGYVDPDSEDTSENDEEHIVELPKKPKNMSPGAVQLRSWLNKSLHIEMSDGRVLVGVFLCTDRDANVILGSCSEYLPESDEEPRMLGLVMIPGKHIVKVHINVSTSNSGTNVSSTSTTNDLETPLKKNISEEEVM